MMEASGPSDSSGLKPEMQTKDDDMELDDPKPKPKPNKPNKGKGKQTNHTNNTPKPTQAADGSQMAASGPINVPIEWIDRPETQLGINNLLKYHQDYKCFSANDQRDLQILIRSLWGWQNQWAESDESFE